MSGLSGLASILQAFGLGLPSGVEHLLRPSLFQQFSEPTSLPMPDKMVIGNETTSDPNILNDFYIAQSANQKPLRMNRNGQKRIRKARDKRTRGRSVR